MDCTETYQQTHVLTFNYQGHLSGFYWLNVSDGPQQLYCYVNENRCCNESDGKWMRIAYLNMSDPSAQCPQDWREVESPIRTCRRENQTSINSVNYSSYGIPYSKVCGRIIAYPEFGTPEGFLGFSEQNQTTMGFQLHMDTQDITSGHLLQQEAISDFNALVLPTKKLSHPPS